MPPKGSGRVRDTASVRCCHGLSARVPVEVAISMAEQWGGRKPISGLKFRQGGRKLKRTLINLLLQSLQANIARSCYSVYCRIIQPQKRTEDTVAPALCVLLALARP